jgi:hypothetical protein
MKWDSLVSCRFWQGAGDRRQGKLSMMQQALSESAMKSAILVTDSEEDLLLLLVVEQPCLTLWSAAKHIDAFNDFWLYGLTKKLKR